MVRGGSLSRRDLLRFAAVAGGTLMFSGAAVATGARAGADPVAVKVSGWGGNDAKRDRGFDRLLLEITATGGDPVRLSELRIYGQILKPDGPILRTANGDPVPYLASGALRYDPVADALVLATDGTPGTLKIVGVTVSPPAGEEFPAMVLVGSDGASWTVRASARHFRGPDYEPMRARGPATIASLRKLSDYLDTRRTETGGWLIGSGFGPVGFEESQGIAGIGTGYLQLYHLTGDDGDRQRAIRAFDWLVNNQPESGAWGLPWAWGRQNAHFGGGVREHYANGQDHPAGTPYSINALMAGRALLTAYSEFRDERYLEGARRVRDYVLDGENGFQWLDEEKTRGSVPYCTVTPVLPPDHPLVAKHDVLEAVRNSSVDVYNVDAYAVRFLDHLRALTGEQRLTRYIKAMLRNLLYRRNPNGSIDYAWCQTNQPDFYTYAVAAGFLRYATFHEAPEILEAGRAMMTWRSNAYPPGGIISEPEGAAPLGLDNSKTAVGYLNYSINTQKPDGSWSGGANTRADADKLNAMTAVLLQAGYHTSTALASAAPRKPELVLSDPVMTPAAFAFDEERNPNRYYP